MVYPRTITAKEIFVVYGRDGWRVQVQANILWRCSNMTLTIVNQKLCSMPNYSLFPRLTHFAAYVLTESD